MTIDSEQKNNACFDNSMFATSDVESESQKSENPTSSTGIGNSAGQDKNRRKVCVALLILLTPAGVGFTTTSVFFLIKGVLVSDESENRTTTHSTVPALKTTPRPVPALKTTPRPGTCPYHQMPCSRRSDACIDKTKRCDGRSDCFGAMDEIHCLRMDPETADHNLHTLQVRNAIRSEWEEICSDGWTASLSNIACQQLGYRAVYAVYYTNENSRFKSKVVAGANEIGADLLQSYLQKGLTSCPSGIVVNILCDKPVCGVRPGHEPSIIRVMGGKEVAYGKWPWMVLLPRLSKRLNHYCGASIIDDDWVLTAAHCIENIDKLPNMLTLKTGLVRRDGHSEYLQSGTAKRIIRHPQYDGNTYENDILLIQLQQPFVMNDYVRPICLPDEKEVASPGTKCHVSGWGHVGIDFPNRNKSMQDVTMDVMSNERCFNLHKLYMRHPHPIVEGMLCAGGIGGHDACQGDSGGPLLCRKDDTADTWYQTGVVSWGYGCGYANVPGVYANVSYYLDWIKSVIDNNKESIEQRYANIPYPLHII